MSSAAQIEANQPNFSKHAVLLNEDDHRQFESLRNSYVYQFSPTNIVEVALLDQLVLAAWNIERTSRLEAEFANAEGIDPLLSEANNKTLDRIVTYRMCAERTFHKCHKELRALMPPLPTSKQNKPLAIVRNEPKYSTTSTRPSPKVGRNEACPCKSGRKYKQCCLRNEPNFQLNQSTPNLAA